VLRSPCAVCLGHCRCTSHCPIPEILSAIGGANVNFDRLKACNMGRAQRILSEAAVSHEQLGNGSALPRCSAERLPPRSLPHTDDQTLWAAGPNSHSLFGTGDTDPLMTLTQLQLPTWATAVSDFAVGTQHMLVTIPGRTIGGEVQSRTNDKRKRVWWWRGAGGAGGGKEELEGRVSPSKLI